MHCHEVFEKLEPYLDRDLPGPEAETLRCHLAECEKCRLLSEREERWRELLADLPVPAASVDFSERVLVAAVGKPAPGRWSAPMVGAAMAASLVLGTSLGLWLPQQAARSPDAVVAQPAQLEARTVRLVFDAERELENVELTLELPPHMELTAFPGRQSVSWRVNLKPGPNVLALPMRVLFPGEGELVARMNDGARGKVFRALIQDAAKERSSPRSS